MTQYKEAPLDKQDGAEVKNFTRTPNMLIFGYHESLSPQEKWLYVCLKHMCGRKGTRHLSLRYISEITGISTGALSTSKNKKGEINLGMIRHLHDAGLIHAEIKKPGRGNPQYHITITDVWALNQAFFDKTCSDFGQDEDTDGEPVRNSDEPVHISDKLVQISDEPVRNSGNTKIRDKITSKTTEQDESMRTQLSEASEKVEKRITNPQIQAISQEMLEQARQEQEQHENETQYHIANGSAIGKDEFRLSAPRLTLASKKVTQETLQQAPGTGMPLPSAAVSPYGRHGDAAGVQAHPLSAPTPAQATISPVAGSTEPAPTAQVSGHIPRRPRGGKPAVLELSLLGMDVKRWIEEIRGAKLRMTAGNVKACNALSECDGVSRESLQAYFAHWEAQKRYVDLLTAAGETGNDKVGFLSFESTWPQIRRKLGGQAPGPAAKEPGTSDFDIYKGNGPEEREAVYQEGLRRLAEGTLIE